MVWSGRGESSRINAALTQHMKGQRAFGEVLMFRPREQEQRSWVGREAVVQLPDGVSGLP